MYKHKWKNEFFVIEWLLDITVTTIFVFALVWNEN
jgi:hypothetical protein